MKTFQKKNITETYQHTIYTSKTGLVAIFISARCKSKKQTQSHVDEDLRIEINGLRFREIPPKKNIQLFNIPSAFNGSESKGLKKTVVFLTVLEKGEHAISLIPRNSAFIEEIKVQELTGIQDIEFKIENQAEDGDRRPWYTFVLVDLPLSYLFAEITIERRFWDSDDVKIIVNGRVKKNIRGGKYKFWYLIGGLLTWTTLGKKGESKRIKIEFDESLDTGVHYLEFWADRMPVLHEVRLSLKYLETKVEKRAANIIQNYASIIKNAANKFNIDSVMVGAVIYQEQATNVNFIDTLTDYIGGLLHLNTSIGIGQIRVKTAEHLEKYYPELDSCCQNTWFIDYNMVRVERLKDPLTNIRYVAAKIHLEPHAYPEANEFGKGVEKNYDKVKKLLDS
ncbi:MAG: hypothetical protein Q8N28_01970 [bacterium]|nr:hypothetical protein [bacterium]